MSSQAWSPSAASSTVYWSDAMVAHTSKRMFGSSSAMRMVFTRVAPTSRPGAGAARGSPPRPAHPWRAPHLIRGSYFATHVMVDEHPADGRPVCATNRRAEALRFDQRPGPGAQRATGGAPGAGREAGRPGDERVRQSPCGAFRVQRLHAGSVTVSRIVRYARWLIPETPSG